jgi:hypothetical protein
MARVARSRSRILTFKGGSSKSTLYNNTTYTSVQADRQFLAQCHDSKGRPVVDSPFTSTQLKGNFPAISGYVEPSTVILHKRREYNELTLASFVPDASMGILPAPAGWMLDLVAGTNPSRPVLNIPEAIENIVQLPGMIRNLGNLMKNAGSPGKPRWLASEYLGVQFGWKPLIEDLLKLLDLQNYVNKRNAELNKLYSGKGLRRRLKFKDDTTVTKTTQSTALDSCTLSMDVTILTHKKQWGVIKWYPTAPPPYHPDDASKNRFVKKLVLGATPEALALGLWKVIPWTWLIGWFTNFGKYTLAHSWTVPATHGTGCFMSQAQTLLSPGPVKVTNATRFALMSSGQLTYTAKTRSVASAPIVGFNMPYLDMFRLSILTALFVQRFFPKR